MATSAAIYLLGEFGPDITLSGVREQVRNNTFADSYTVYIDSIGGDFQEGFAVHDFLKSIGKPITTVNIGKVYSIATVPYLAAPKNRRLSRPHAEFLLHNPWIHEASGDSERLASLSKELDKAERQLETFYSRHMRVSQASISDHMRQNTIISAQEAHAMGVFGAYTQASEMGIAARKPVTGSAVARFKTTKFSNDMSMNALEVLASLSKTLESVTAQMPTAKNAYEDDEMKAVTIPLEDGNELFVESEDGDLIGKPAYVNNEPAPDGSHTDANGRVIVTEGGVVTEVVEPEAMEDEDKDKMGALAAENEELKQQLAQATEAAKGVQAQFEELQAKYSKIAKEPMEASQSNDDAKVAAVRKTDSAKKNNDDSIGIDINQLKSRLAKLPKK